MNDDNEFDINDLEAAVEHHRATRPPRDITKTPYTGSNRELAALTGQTVEVITHEITPTGVTEHCETATITAPIINNNQRNPHD